MFNLQLDWDRPNQLSSQSANHILRIRLNPTNPGSRTLPLHLAIVLDTSQSMKDEKLTSAKQACQEIFKHLRDRDKPVFRTSFEKIKIDSKMATE